MPMLFFQTLLKAFFENISCVQAAFRRAAANMILATCLNCRRPQFFLNYVLKHLLGKLMNVIQVQVIYILLIKCYFS